MTDKEYAVRIYCLVFHVKDDGGDANIQGILNTVGALEDRERTLLECYYRRGMTYAQIGRAFSLSGEQAGRIIKRAVLKLRHPSRWRPMSMARIEKDRAVKNS